MRTQRSPTAIEGAATSSARARRPRSIPIAVEVVDGGAQSDRLRRHRRARPRTAAAAAAYVERLHRDRLDHRAAREERRHARRAAPAAVEHADAGRARASCGRRRPAKSTPRPCTSTGRCGTDWQASSTVSAPTACARSTMRRDRVDRAEHVGLVGERDDLGALVDQRVESQVEPAVVGRRPNQRSVAPVRCASSCHGTRLAWCSISVTTISSPGPRRNRSAPASRRRRCERVGDQVERLGGVLGEDHLVARRAPTNAATVVARVLEGVGGLLASWWAPRCTAALWCS